MGTRNLEKMASIDAQLRLLAPGKVSEDDKFVEYDALLLDRFLDILQDLHGEEIRETVINFNFLSTFFKYMSFVLLCDLVHCVNSIENIAKSTVFPFDFPFPSFLIFMFMWVLLFSEFDLFFFPFWVSKIFSNLC